MDDGQRQMTNSIQRLQNGKEKCLSKSEAGAWGSRFYNQYEKHKLVRGH